MEAAKEAAVAATEVEGASTSEEAMAWLTLELIARYEGEEFSLNGKTESGAYQRYFPAASGKAEPSHGVRRLPERQSGSGQESDPPGNRFWRRNVLAER